MTLDTYLFIVTTLMAVSIFVGAYFFFRLLRTIHHAVNSSMERALRQIDALHDEVATLKEARDLGR